MQFKLTLALTLSALAAAVPSKFEHHAREHAVEAGVQAKEAVVDTALAGANIVDNNIVQPAVYAKDQAVAGAVHVGNAAVDTTNAAIDNAKYAKDKTVAGAKHAAHEVEQSTPVQGAEASKNWLMKKTNDVFSSTTGAMSRMFGNVAANTADNAQYYEQNLHENQAQIDANIQARKEQAAALKAKAEEQAAEARAKVQHNVFEPVAEFKNDVTERAVEIKEDVSERTSSTFENLKAGAHSKMTNLRNALSPSVIRTHYTVNGTYTKVDLNGERSEILDNNVVRDGPIVKTEITEELLPQNLAAKEALNNSAVGLSLVATAAIVAVQLLI